jgi:hypothetical protein
MRFLSKESHEELIGILEWKKKWWWTSIDPKGDTIISWINKKKTCFDLNKRQYFSKSWMEIVEK